MEPQIKNLASHQINLAQQKYQHGGPVRGYSVNTFHGIKKNYNEDRVTIIMNMKDPQTKDMSEKCHYFGVFDGHGGKECSSFLKENLHKFVYLFFIQITNQKSFPSDPITALKGGFQEAQSKFQNLAIHQNPILKAGSCALIVLIVGDVCYIANVGDSRAILSSHNGQKVLSITEDHKPNRLDEKIRIQKAGGSVYRAVVKTNFGFSEEGPHRILPGKLSVSRSFGDVQAKLKKFGGNPEVLIAQPQIMSFQIDKKIHDFIVLGSDGIYDKMSNFDITQCYWQYKKKNQTQEFLKSVSSRILSQSMKRLSTDNLSAIVIYFSNDKRFKDEVQNSNLSEIQCSQQQNKQNVQLEQWNSGCPQEQAELPDIGLIKKQSCEINISQLEQKKSVNQQTILNNSLKTLSNPSLHHMPFVFNAEIQERRSHQQISMFNIVPHYPVFHKIN